jgi:hypothetical protein
LTEIILGKEETIRIPAKVWRKIDEECEKTVSAEVKVGVSPLPKELVAWMRRRKT